MPFPGQFLYLLGKPLSEDENQSDKRLVSSLIAESGNNCSLSFRVIFQGIMGTNIEVTTQNVDNAYTPIYNRILQKGNDTSRE